MLSLWAGTALGAWAHCDTMDGPVVKDAQIALEKADVTPVLKPNHQPVRPQADQPQTESLHEH